MEDVTDTVFRQLVLKCGRPDIFFTEFTSTDGLFSKGRERVIHRLKFDKREGPIVAQIWGKNPENYWKAAQLLAEFGFDGIDINMGCPVEKIVKSGNCSALIENPSLVSELIRATREGAPQLPLSVKTRLGFSSLNTEEWCGFLLNQDIHALTVHGRIAKHLSKYRVKWEEIQKVVQLRDSLKRDIVVVGNGDVKSLSEVDEKVRTFGVDGVMMGRAIFENLYLFSRDSIPLSERSVSEKLSLLLEHIDLFESTWGETKPFRILKKFFKNYITNFWGASELRASAIECETSQEVKDLLQKFLLEYSSRELDSRPGTLMNDDKESDGKLGGKRVEILSL